MTNSIRATSSTTKKVLTLPHCYWHSLTGVNESILRGYWHPAFSFIDALSHICWYAPPHSFHCSPQTKLVADNHRWVNIHATSSPASQACCFTSSPFLCIDALSISSPMVWFPWKQSLQKNKKKTVSRVSELFSSSNFSFVLSLPVSPPSPVHWRSSSVWSDQYH